MRNPYAEPAYRTGRQLILAVDEHGQRPACHWCGKPATTADHIVPLAEGGDHQLDNLVPACQRCNAVRGSRLGVQRRRELQQARFLEAVEAEVERRLAAMRARPAIGYATSQPSRLPICPLSAQSR